MSAKRSEAELISPEEIAAQGGPSVSTQAKLRMNPGWLPYMKLGGSARGKVVYLRADWRAYLAARLQKHTRDKPKSAAAPPTGMDEAAGIVGSAHPDDLEKLKAPHRTRA